jgi:mannosyltransferase
LAVKHASGIICISKNTKKDLLSFYSDIDSEKVSVIYLAANDCFYKINEIEISKTIFKKMEGKKILSFIGNRIKYKNFSLAVEIVKKLPKDYCLMIVGGGEFTEGEKSMTVSIEDRVFYYKSLSSQELNIVYNISFCYLYLSEYEGFGIPVLEAMQASCPVLCQNVSSIPEVYGEVENIVKDLNNVEECCENVLKLENVEFRNRIIEQGKTNARKFTWDETYRQTLNFYNYINNN